MQTFTIERRLQAICLVLAPLTFTLSTFFWQNGEYTPEAATLIVVSMFLWIPALAGLFGKLKAHLPRYAVWGYWVAVWGCISGICFAMLGYLATVFAISHNSYLETLSRYSLSSQFLLFASGPIFPLSLLVLGINLLRTKNVTTAAGLLLCIGALAFPASRISRIEWVAHVADVLLLAACVMISTDLVRGQHESKGQISVA